MGKIYTPEQIFLTEYKAMFKIQNSLNQSFRVSQLPSLVALSKDECLSRYLVRGITCPYFEQLNNTFVLQYDGVLTRRLSLNGKFLYDKNNAVRRQAVPKPQNCVAILSTKSIKLRNYIEDDKTGIKTERVITKDYQFVDYQDITVNPSQDIIQWGLKQKELAKQRGYSADSPELAKIKKMMQGESTRYYVYIIPKDKLQPINRMCLIVSDTPRRKYYDGLRVTLTNGKYVYLYILPFDKRFMLTVEGMMEHFKVLDISPLDIEVGTQALNYLQKSQQKLLNFWCQMGIVYDYAVTTLQEGVNVAYTPLGAKELDIATYSMKLEEPELEYNSVPTLSDEEIAKLESEKKAKKEASVYKDLLDGD